EQQRSIMFVKEPPLLSNWAIAQQRRLFHKHYGCFSTAGRFSCAVSAWLVSGARAGARARKSRKPAKNITSQTARSPAQASEPDQTSILAGRPACQKSRR